MSDRTEHPEAEKAERQQGVIGPKSRNLLTTKRRRDDTVPPRSGRRETAGDDLAADDTLEKLEGLLREFRLCERKAGETREGHAERLDTIRGEIVALFRSLVEQRDEARADWEAAVRVSGVAREYAHELEQQAEALRRESVPREQVRELLEKAWTRGAEADTYDGWEFLDRDRDVDAILRGIEPGETEED